MGFRGKAGVNTVADVAVTKVTRLRYRKTRSLLEQTNDFFFNRQYR